MLHFLSHFARLRRHFTLYFVEIFFEIRFMMPYHADVDDAIDAAVCAYAMMPPRHVSP